MDTLLNAEEREFAQKMRQFYRTEIPEELRFKVATGQELTKEDMVTSQRILNQHGYAVPNWPVEWGGQDWTPVQRHIWLEEMQLACVPQPLPFNVSMVGPVIATFGSQERRSRSASFPPPPISTSGGHRASPNPMPALTSHR
ncbi:acyl-CoA dehydrogenase family protein [Brevibacterium sp. UCMA 11754]|uniref:acyl-CoA dehydrogenase family protein n=1 Tax=Brevibacterium sp. UCMA 11754 TaxID=2749198 RepID=UPI0022854E8E|nr:acyl-CoA dehydrogenase family protein [Brevibacterium sp. UCMA 11754]